MKQRIVVVFGLLLGATFGGLTSSYADTHQSTAVFSGDPTPGISAPTIQIVWPHLWRPNNNASKLAARAKATARSSA